MPAAQSIPSPLTSQEVLDRYFLEVRSKLLDVAAVLDRIDRARPADSTAADPRLHTVRAALAMLADPGSTTRAEAVQTMFSRPYDADWMDDFPGPAAPTPTTDRTR
ncbi:MAG: hypothetical protein ACRDD1_16085 [Planctomycetia bacterium]